MNKLHCPECQSVNVKPLQLAQRSTTFALVVMKDNLIGGSLYVNLIRYTDCGFTWFKLTDKSIIIIRIKVKFLTQS